MVKELLLGDNPFIGVSHLAQEKAMEEARKASLENKVKVFEAAVDNGASGFTFSAEESNLELLTHLGANDKNLIDKMNFYILIPYAHSYVRRANVGGTPALIRSTLKKMLSRPSAMPSMLIALMSFTPEKFFNLFIEAELAPFLDVLPKGRIVVLMHEILTELIMAFNLIGLLNHLDSHVMKKFGTGFGLETRNLGHLYRYVSESGYNPKYLMTPINPLGYQMAPNIRAIEEAVDDMGEKTRIIAINILASGVVNLNESIEYIKKYEDKIYAITTASMNSNRIRDNFKKLSQVFLYDAR